MAKRPPDPQPAYRPDLYLPRGLPVRYHNAGDTFIDSASGAGWGCVQSGDPGIWEIGWWSMREGEDGQAPA
jgi:hypothetical protein